jgi:hypothetical protein
MSGDEQQRFCGQCSKDVHNLSEMTEPEARTLLKQPNVCVRVATRSDGTIRFQSRRRFLAAAIATTIALPATAAVEAQAETGGALARLASAAYSLLFGAPEPEPVEVEMGDIAPIEHVLMGAPVPEPAVEETQRHALGKVQAR